MFMFSTLRNNLQTRLAMSRPISQKMRGMTLMEILIVLVLLGVIIGIVAPKIIGGGDNAKAKATKLQLEKLNQTLDLYKLELGRYPNTQEGLTALLKAPEGMTSWNGPYVKSEADLKDAWSNLFHYASPGAAGKPYDLISYGADGKEGGEGNDKDITN